MYSEHTTDARTAAHELLDCYAAFGTPSGLMYDLHTRVWNEKFMLLSKGRSPHYFNTNILSLV